jgi:hypothetical protein
MQAGSSLLLRVGSFTGINFILVPNQSAERWLYGEISSPLLYYKAGMQSRLPRGVVYRNDLCQNLGIRMCEF